MNVKIPKLEPFPEFFFPTSYFYYISQRFCEKLYFYFFSLVTYLKGDWNRMKNLARCVATNLGQVCTRAFCLLCCFFFTVLMQYFRCFLASHGAMFCNQPMTCKFATTFPLTEFLSTLCRDFLEQFSTSDAADSPPTRSGEGACLCSKVMTEVRGFNHSVACRSLTSEPFVVYQLYGWSILSSTPL